jgi:DNA-binding NtrC family response regulator
MIGRFPDKRCFAVYLSDSTEKALGLCKTTKFDLVLTDFDLGENSGIELLNEIKETKPKTKTILMSGSFTFEEEILKAEGIDAFLQKPFEVKELRNLIKKVLEL